MFCIITSITLYSINKITNTISWMNCFIVPPPTGCWARIAAYEADRDGPLRNGGRTIETMWNVLGWLLHNNPRPSLFFSLECYYYTLGSSSIWRRRCPSPSAAENNLLEQTIRCWTIALRWWPAATMDWRHNGGHRRHHWRLPGLVQLYAQHCQFQTELLSIVMEYLSSAGVVVLGE